MHISPTSNQADLTRPTSRDRGFSLVELLVSMIIAGTLVTTMTFAYSTFLKAYPPTIDRVAVAKDVTFIQAWLPIDLASAIEIDSDPLAQPSASNPNLPGVNVLVISRLDLQIAGHPPFLVNYRYQQRGDEWVLVRYEIRNPGNVGAVGETGGLETVSEVGIAHELVEPPADWDQTTAPTFAIDVQGRNPGRLRKVGNDVTVKFSNGTSYDTGGAGLGPGDLLAAAAADGFVNPTSPPSRCGGRMTLLVDTSGSLSSKLQEVKDAAKDFVDAFQGTPTLLRVTEFDSVGKAVAPTTWDAPAIDMLNLSNAGVTDAKQDIQNIAANTGGTNWEAGLRIAMADFDDMVGIAPSPHVPDTVVFFTDGRPWKYVNSSGNTASGDSATNVAEAKSISNKKGEWGVTLKGVFVTAQTGNSLEDDKNRLKEVVGPTEWIPGPEDASGNATIGNADAADLFVTNDFDELSNVFQQIFASDCGGTVTIQRRELIDPLDIEGANTPVLSGSYDYSTSTGTGILRVQETQSITFDYDLADGTGFEWVDMTESSTSGEDIANVKCYHNGDDVTATRVEPLYDDAAQTIPVPSGRRIKVVANEALSCLFIGV